MFDMQNLDRLPWLDEDVADTMAGAAVTHGTHLLAD